MNKETLNSIGELLNGYDYDFRWPQRFIRHKGISFDSGREYFHITGTIGNYRVDRYEIKNTWLSLNIVFYKGIPICVSISNDDTGMVTANVTRVNNMIEEYQWEVVKDFIPIDVNSVNDKYRKKIQNEIINEAIKVRNEILEDDLGDKTVIFEGMLNRHLVSFYMGNDGPYNYYTLE